MKKIFLAISLLVIIALLYGCAEKAEYETPEGGKVEVEGTAGIESWCPEGGDWSAKWSAPDADGAGTAEWKVDKLMTSGKYEGLCHVIYTSTTGQGKTRLDYYYSEDGESGYYEMVMPDGSKFSQSFGME